MNELKNVKVSLISFVDKGANQRTFIMKAGENTFNSFVPIRKYDAEKGIVYGVVYAPDDEDAHGDFMSTDTVEKAAHDFLSQSNTIKAMDTQHNLNVVDGCTIVESFINKGHEYFKEAKDKDAWVIAVKVENEEIKKSVKDGTFTGFSLYGTAERAGDESKSEKSFMSHVKKFFTGEDDEHVELIKDFNERYQKYQVRTAVDAMSCEAYDIIYDDMNSLDERKQALIQLTDDFKALLDTINIGKSEIDKVSKAGKVLSSANAKKVQAAVDALNSLLALAEKSAESKEKLQKSIKTKTNMETTDVKKAEHDKIVKDKDDEIAKLKAGKEKLETASKGSQQVKDDGTGDTKVKKSFNWIPPAPAAA